MRYSIETPSLKYVSYEFLGSRKDRPTARRHSAATSRAKTALKKIDQALAMRRAARRSA